MCKPRLLDLFCSAGGASKGYSLAGFDVVGVDIAPQPHYPFEFHQADALTFSLEGFDAIHASPECKSYTNCNLSPKEKYQQLIAPIRERLIATGKPYIIENVMGAKKHMNASIMLCGTMFGLRTMRHRLFETNIPVFFPPFACDHRDAPIAVYGHSVWDSSLIGTRRKDGKSRPDSVSIEIGRATMGIDWMNMDELAEALPPVYTRFLGEQLLAYVESECVV